MHPATTPARSVRRLLTAVGVAALGVSLALGGGLPAAAVTDTRGPVVSDFAFTPAIVDVGTMDAEIHYSMRITDDASGTSGGIAMLTRRGDYRTVSALHRLVSGDELDGRYEGTLVIPKFSRPGIWEFSILLSDEVRNSSSGPILNASGEVATVTVVALERLTATGAPIIVGDPSVGSLLRLTGDADVAWSRTPDRVEYRWLRDGVEITGAHGPEYILQNSDAGTAITAELRASLDGYSDGAARSAPVNTVGGTFTNVTTPRITDGWLMSATDDTWEPGPARRTYQWLRDGVPIDGKTSSTYTSTGADAGHDISVAVTAHRSGFDSKTAVSDVRAFGGGRFTVTAPLTVSGTEVVHGELNVIPASWSPEPTDLRYQWHRNGHPIEGATGTTLTILPEYAGSQISATATADRRNYDTVTSTSTPVTITPATFSTATPTVSGSPTVGATLTAATGAWAPAPETFAYQWLRNGSAISGATSSSYKLSAADAGRSVSVRVTGTAVGYTSASAISAARTISKALTAPKPTVSGSTIVGSTLTVKTGTWGPAPVSVKVQWLRDGVTIAGATKTTYKLGSADAGKTVTARVTGSRSGYTTVVTTSAGKPTLRTLTATPAPAISGSGSVGSTLTVKTYTWGPSPVALKVQWFRNGAAISGATGSNYKLVTADAGRTITVRVTGSRSGYASVAKTSAGKAIARVLSAPTPSISGSSVIGSTLTAKTGAWGPAPVTVKVQWFRDGKPISGATKTSYRLINADAGRTITVRVTGSKSGYTTATKTSAGKKATWPANPGNSKNCSDFRAQAEAQAWFDRYYAAYGDVAQLDRDKDRIACEELR